MPRLPSKGASPSYSPRRRNQIILAVAALLVMLGLLVWSWQDRQTPAPSRPSHSYAQTLELARNGKPGAARVLYQQLTRTDLADARRIALLAELPNYPSPQALKLLDAQLHHASPEVREAAVRASVRLVSRGQLSMVLGPMLDDQSQAVRFSATTALMGLSPDELGLYFAVQQQGLEAFREFLATQPATAQNQLQLARSYEQTGDSDQALAALQRAIAAEPDNLEAALAHVELLDHRGQAERARGLFARLLERHPDSAPLQHALGEWLLQHDQAEYALLSLAKASELEPRNTDYRYDLAVALHALDQLEPAQKQLAQILQDDPANRRARLLLIEYWKQTGQLQNVQVLLAELEQQNPDDPALQQGL